ncbi:GNAT family N-acetyltransferase [Geobacillus thermoleovorans]|uniref:GNAT family N-acetyltransferase n=1 Tax=Geobacillus thermoleovorans TaxID=33941 RepID=UPI000839DE9A|nr:GNAT family N-acetyltransferase [Geobacillus thermoleovorans]ODA16111.1 GNAT family N-acetyltransferase [Geobacillus thermoleovorans]QHN49462.1 GNAT family N-acetyltransferase [Geobacillus stearothermophilus]TLS33132.1 GNAT family N-acetyltransferase [Geobacillus thermoleovorans]
MNIVPTKQLDRTIVNQFFNDHWGSPQMVVSTGIYTCSELDGFAAVENGSRIVGLITFVIRGNECEIISLDSIMENRGIGSALLHEAEAWARQQRCTAVQLITTNDNLHALRFYQKRGYQIVNVFPNAVDKARQIKPNIPKTSPDGIPIRDELLLVKPLV